MKKENLTQAYRQKPWRIQMQWVSRVLTILVIVVLAVVLNLNIISRSAHAGVQVRILEAERERLQRTISGNRTTLAQLTSSTVMKQRAKELGYEPARKDQIEYIYLAGYLEKDSLPVDVPIQRNQQNNNLIKPVYTQSIWDWLFQGTFTLLDRKGR
jgi:uncharacterized protein YpmS